MDRGLENFPDRDAETRFYTNEKLRGDTATRTAYIQAMRQNGVLTGNECRLLEERNPVGPEGDILWAPINMQTAEQLMLGPADPLAKAALADEEPASGTKPPTAKDDNPAGDDGSDIERYSPIVDDAIRRYFTRSDKGSEAITKVFEPLFTLIAVDAVKAANKRFNTVININSEKLIREAAKSVLSRSEKWNLNNMDMKSETEKITRGIRLEVFRQAGAQIALEGTEAA